MMVLVDTTVWVDFLGDTATSQVTRLQTLIESDEDLCTCGVISAETLQGIRSDSDYRRTKAHLDSLIFLPIHRATFVRAAELYRSLRKSGITVRKPVDCMIAAVAIEHESSLLHNDRDFDNIARHSKLRILKTEKPTR
jgi:predicted nucleic acid-binding protein